MRNVESHVPAVDVLIVDDSPAARALLMHVLQADPGLRIVGAVADGLAAIEYLAHRRPDVIVMDIHMPRMGGFEATRRIMETRPVPIIVCSASADAAEVATAFQAMEAGALACIEKPCGPGHPDFERTAAELRQLVRTLCDVKLVRRWASRRTDTRPAAASDRPRRAIGVVGIGASTGGPQVLQQVLAALPGSFSVPILVVQHIAPGFVTGLAEWLTQTTGRRCVIARQGVLPLPGQVYVAPDDRQMALSPAGRLVVTTDGAEHRVRPSVSYLFRSLAETCGPSAVGVLLSGMGIDGAHELKLMKDAGAITIAQDRETSVVHGMPGAAIAIGGATHVLPSDRIARALAAIVRECNEDDR